MTESNEPWGHLLSTDRVLNLHTSGMDEFGGARAIERPTGCIEGALGAALNAEAYTAGKKHAIAGLAFAGHVLYYLAFRHCFLDGNKRIAWIAAMDVLESLGLSIRATQDEAFEMMMAVLDGTIPDGAAVCDWMASRLYSV